MATEIDEMTELGRRGRPPTSPPPGGPTPS